MALIYPVTGAATSAGALLTGSGLLFDIDVRETSGSARAAIRVWDNASAASGPCLADIGVASGTSVVESFGEEGEAFALGLYLEIVTGAVEVTIGARKQPA